MVAGGFHSVDHEFRADDFDDRKWRPAATRPDIEQAPVVLMLELHWVLDRVFDVRVGDAVFTCFAMYLHSATVGRDSRRDRAFCFASVSECLPHTPVGKS
jgi:hypothetical protein